MQQRMICNLQRTLRVRPFQCSRSCSTLTRAGRASLIQSVQNDIRSKRRSAEEVARQYLDAIARSEPTLNAFITVNADQALQQDNICTQGLRTTAGSQVLRDFTPRADATAVARLRQAGAVTVGKTNMDEFGMGSSTENSSFQPTRNPCDTSRVPGGSSGGSAAAVAAHECVAALGSDTGGSIRQPAHFCGVVGVKPTYGRVSRSGLVAYASSLDVIGPMAHTVHDAALVLNAIAGVDSLDSTSSSEPVPDFTSRLQPASSLTSTPLAGRRLGLVTQCLGQGVQPGVEAAVRDAAKKLEALGAVVEEVSLPNFDVGLPAYYVLALSEASSNLSRYDGVRYGARVESGGGLAAMYANTRAQGLGPEVKRRILMGTYGLSAGYYDAYYKRAQQVRALVRGEMTTALAKYDALITPTAPTPAYKLGEKSSDPLEMYKGDLMTVNVNLAGLPAVVVPCAYVPAVSDGAAAAGNLLPVGLQLVGRAFGEADLLEIAHVFEQTLALEAPAVQGA